MSRYAFVPAILLLALTTGCATSQNVQLAQLSGAKQVSTVALTQ
jgi:hypothetical protein